MVELHCDADSSPPPIRRWYMNGVPINDVASKSNRTVSNDGRVLRIVNLNHDIDTAVYQCNASNPMGYVFANAFVNVLGRDKQ